jgi:hypothetical protein
LLAIVALVACYVAVRRALRVDAVVALKSPALRIASTARDRAEPPPLT